MQNLMIDRRKATMLGSLFVWTEDVLRHFHLLLAASLSLYLILRYFQLENRRAVLLFSLALPGALVWVIALSVSAVFSTNFQYSFSAIVVFFPASWILPIVAAVQGFKLRARNTNVGLVGSASAVLLACLYLLTAFLQRAS